MERHSIAERTHIKRDFIHAVMKKYEALGTGMLRDLYRPNSTITLKELINEFSITTSNSLKDTSYGRSHATLGITKDTEPLANSSQGPQGARSRSSSSRPRKPCSDITSKPESRACKSRASCNVINPALRPSKQDRNNEWQTYFNNYVQWCRNHEEGARIYIERHNDSELKEILEKHRPRSTDRSERSVVAVTISSSAIALANRSTVNLADRWGLDTCSDIHVVNDPSKADFTPTRQPPANLKLDVGNTSLPVVAIGNCQLRMTDPQGNAFNLTLTDVAYVPGFHINLVSERRLRKAGLWYHGKDNLLYQTSSDGHDIPALQLERPTMSLPFLTIVTPPTRDGGLVYNWPVHENGDPVSTADALSTQCYYTTSSFAVQSSYHELHPRRLTSPHWHEVLGHIRP